MRPQRQMPFSAPFIPLPYLQVHETWAQLQYCFRCQETMVSNKAHGISAFKDSDSHSSLLKMFLCRLLLKPPMVLIHAITKIKYHALCLTLFPFSSVPSRTSWVLFGAKYCLSPTPPIDKQAYKSQEPDPSPASKSSITRSEEALMISRELMS